MNLLSLDLLFFLLISLVIYYSVNEKYRIYTLVFINMGFLVLINIYSLIYLLFVLIVTYFIGKSIINRNHSKKNYLVLIYVIFILGGLVLLKYGNIHLNLFNKEANSVAVNILIPLGISFYSFQGLSYIIEIKNERIKPEKDIFILSNYMMFFPKLPSGPIEAPKYFISQCRETKKFDYELFTDGIKIMTWGIFKKLVVADRLVVITDEIFNNINNYNGISILIGILFLSFQIYADFSGFIDIALGIGMMFGYKLTDNFKQPYLSVSIKDFWTRWHITLSNWAKKYIFLPVAYKTAKLKFNIFGLKIKQDYLGFIIGTLATFLVIGIWHGARWTYILWGLSHGFFLIFSLLTKKIRIKINKFFPSKIAKYKKIILTFLLVTFTWIIFRINDLSDLTVLTKNIFSVPADTSFFNLEFANNIPAYSAFYFSICIIGIIVIIISDLINNKKSFIKFINGKPLVFRWAIYFILFFSIIYFKTNPYNFIYIQF